MPETPRFTMFVSQNATQLVTDMNYVLDQSGGSRSPATTAADNAEPVMLESRKISYADFFRKYWVTLLGTCSCWFLLDISFYSQNLTQPTVFTSVGWLPSAYTMSITREAYMVARAQAIIAVSSTVPGYWVTVFTIEKLGRFKIQLMGFFCMTVLMAVLAGDFNNLVNHHQASFVAIYALTFFFANFGPNSTTFVVPAEVFPTQYRSLGHGISAACGKAGAIVGAFGFNYMQMDVSTQAALALLTGVNFLGLLCTFLVPETKGKSLEEITDDGLVMKSENKNASLNGGYETNKNVQIAMPVKTVEMS